MTQVRMGAAMVLAALALAGCGEKKTVEAKNASAGEVAAQVAASDFHLQPGEWETTAKMSDISVEGMPPAMAEAMKSQAARGGMGQPHVSRSCLTKAEADKPRGSFFGKPDAQCTYKDFTMSGGKITGTMTCKGKDGDETVAMNGTYQADSYDMDLAIVGHGGGHTVNVHMATSSRRVGDCPPDGKAP